METCRRRRHRASMDGINGLIAIAVQCLGLAAPAHIGRQWRFAERFELRVEIAVVMELETKTAAT
jgi:hypothetical protein